MVKIKLVRVAAAAAASAGLIAGISGVASAYTGGNYNDHHRDNPFTKTISKMKTNSTNNVTVSNSVDQSAVTGDANAYSTDNHHHHHYEDGNQGNSGDATTGDATNSSNFKLDASVSNGSQVAGSNNMQGGHSDSFTLTKVDSNSTNNVTVSNSVDQSAVSGNANAYGSNNSGNATSGSATNTSNANISLNVSN